MQTKGSPKQYEERDIELENIVGNLMIAEYQVDRLRTRLSEKIPGSAGFITGTVFILMGLSGRFFKNVPIVLLNTGYTFLFSK